MLSGAKFDKGPRPGLGPQRSRIAERWGGRSEVFDKGFLSVPTRFLRGYALGEAPLSSVEAMLILVLMTFKWGRDDPFPSYELLGRMMGVSARMVSRYARSLEKKGYLVRNRRTGTTNKFDLSPLFERLGALPATRAEVAEVKNRTILKSQRQKLLTAGGEMDL